MIRGMKTGIIYSKIYHEDGGDDNDDLDAIVEVAALLGVILLKLGLSPVPPPETKHLRSKEGIDEKIVPQHCHRFSSKLTVKIISRSPLCSSYSYNC